MQGNLKSTNLETHLFKKVLNGLLQFGIPVKEIVTDANSQIISVMSECKCRYSRLSIIFIRTPFLMIFIYVFCSALNRICSKPYHFTNPKYPWAGLYLRGAGVGHSPPPPLVLFSPPLTFLRFLKFIYY